jgi:hypothetical protein
MRKNFNDGNPKTDRHVLSKSTFIKGVNCKKALYLNKHGKDLRDELSASQLAIFSQGTAVGELAQDLFPGGVDCSSESYYDFQKSIQKTKDEIEKGTKVIYEAAFQFNGVFAALDILVLEKDGWHAYEVKSSTSVSANNVLDTSLQYYAITNSGVVLNDISIIFVNKEYMKEGPLDNNRLFAFESVHDRVLVKMEGIPDQIRGLKKVLTNSEVPSIEIGQHCHKPYSCEFVGHCWKKIPEYSVFDIANLSTVKKQDLYNRGILDFENIPADFPLTKNQWKQVKSELNGEIHIERNKIKQFVDEVVYPIYHLDFETFRTAAPVFDYSRPYQPLVFQYSLHIEHKDGRVEHKEFLAQANGLDPRTAFVEQLVNECGSFGSVMVYSSYESTQLKSLIEFVPEQRIALQEIVDRIVDLIVPFRERWYYTPAMKGSHSIKKVLPALVPDLSYEELPIKDGEAASSIFSQMVQGAFQGDVEETRNHLLEYCKMDTLALVRIYKHLKSLVNQ